MPCYVEKPKMEFSEVVERWLCFAFKKLTKKEMQAYPLFDIYYSAYAWYVDHLAEDYIKNKGTKEGEEAIKEAARVGCTIWEDKDGNVHFKADNETLETIKIL